MKYLKKAFYFLIVLTAMLGMAFSVSAMVTGLFAMFRWAGCSPDSSTAVFRFGGWPLMFLSVLASIGSAVTIVWAFLRSVEGNKNEM